MTPAIRELFDYTSRHVTPADISRYAPNDPGYPDYVRAFTRILSSGILPTEFYFEITEIRDPVGFRSPRWGGVHSTHG